MNRVHICALNEKGKRKWVYHHLDVETISVDGRIIFKRGGFNGSFKKRKKGSSKVSEGEAVKKA